MKKLYTNGLLAALATTLFYSLPGIEKKITHTVKIIQEVTIIRHPLGIAERFDFEIMPEAQLIKTAIDKKKINSNPSDPLSTCSPYARYNSTGTLLEQKYLMQKDLMPTIFLIHYYRHNHNEKLYNYLKSFLYYTFLKILRR